MVLDTPLESPVFDPDTENETLSDETDRVSPIDCEDGLLTTIVSVALPDKMYVVVSEPVQVVVVVVNE